MTDPQIPFPWSKKNGLPPNDTLNEVISRRQRGYEIFESGGVQKILRRSQWRVDSQRVHGAHYTVRHLLGRFVCNCPDFADRVAPCKHIFAVEFSGGKAEQQNRPKRARTAPTKPRDWRQYNQAKPIVEGRVAELLASMGKVFEGPGSPRRGNKPAPLSDLLFASVMRVYVSESGRDFCGDVLQRWVDQGFVSRLYHFNTLSAFMRQPIVSLVLTEFIRESSSPLVQLPSPVRLGIDSTGFSTSSSSTWYDAKFGRTKKRDYIKLHFAIDTLTHIVTDVVVTSQSGTDTLQLPKLLRQSAKRLIITEVSADRAYAGKPNYDAIEGIGALPLIPPRGNMTGGKSELMRKMFHAFRAEDPDVLARYHKRSNAETVPFMIKTQFGDTIAARSDIGQVNELLAKVLCHNLHCLVMASITLGLEVRLFKSDKAA